MSAVGRGRSRSRVATYKYDVQSGFDESAVEEVLAQARAAGTVTEYDTGRGRVCWFEGAPGEAMRALRKRVLEMLGPGARAWR